MGGSAAWLARSDWQAGRRDSQLPATVQRRFARCLRKSTIAGMRHSTGASVAQPSTHESQCSCSFASDKLIHGRVSDRDKPVLKHFV
jgi:hypothetical protein